MVRVPAMPECALEGRKALKSFATTEAHDAVFVYFPSIEQPEAPAFAINSTVLATFAGSLAKHRSESTLSGIVTEVASVATCVSSLSRRMLWLACLSDVA